jgi:hypothetical protein
MAVTFATVTFQNNNNIEILLTIEAPIGKSLVVRHPVGPNQTASIRVGRDNCDSVALVADDGSHSSVTQTFKVAAPDARMVLPSFLEQVDVQYSIGTFRGGFKARTEQG